MAELVMHFPAKEASERAWGFESSRCRMGRWCNWMHCGLQNRRFRIVTGSACYGVLAQLVQHRISHSENAMPSRRGISKTGIPKGSRGSNPLHVVWQRTQAGLRGLTANQVFVGSNPTVVLQIVTRWERISPGFLI